MQILNAIDYGTRTIIRVWMNDNEPATSHRDGSGHTKSSPTELADLMSAKNLFVVLNSPDPEEKDDWERILAQHQANKSDPLNWCVECVNQQVVQRFQFEGDALFKEIEISAAVEAIPAIEAIEATDDTPAVEAVEGTPAIRAVTQIQPKTDKELVDDALQMAADSIPKSPRVLVV